MSVFKKQSLVKSYPAFNVYQRSPDRSGFVNLTANEQLILKKNNDYLSTFTIASAVSYALDYNEDPIASYERSKARGEKLHWINSNGACIASSYGEPEDMIAVEYGMKVCFEGHYFTIEKDFNDNLKLVPVEK